MLIKGYINPKIFFSVGSHEGEHLGVLTKTCCKLFLGGKLYVKYERSATSGYKNAFQSGSLLWAAHPLERVSAMCLFFKLIS